MSSPRRTPAMPRSATASATDAVHRPTGGVGGTRQGVSASTPTTPGTWRVEPIGRSLGRRPAGVDAQGRDHRNDRRPPRRCGDDVADDDRRAARGARRRRSPVPRSLARSARSPTTSTICSVSIPASPSGAASSSSATRRGTSPSSKTRASARRRDDEDPGRPRRPRGPVRTLATRPARRPAAQPGAATRSRRHDPGGVPAVLAIMRRLQLSTAVAVHGAGALMRHPSGRPQIPSPLRLYGNRVMLRPLVAHDFGAWRDVRRRNEAWLTPRTRRRSPVRPERHPGRLRV